MSAVTANKESMSLIITSNKESIPQNLEVRPNKESIPQNLQVFGTDHLIRLTITFLKYEPAFALVSKAWHKALKNRMIEAREVAPLERAVVRATAILQNIESDLVRVRKDIDFPPLGIQPEQYYTQARMDQLEHDRTRLTQARGRASYGAWRASVDLNSHKPKK